MKKRACIGLLVMSLFVSLAAATSASAGSGPELAAHIPFDFYVRGELMPAGKYAVRRVTDDGKGLQIRSADGSQKRFILTNAALAKGRPGPARLTFNKYQDQHFLSAVWQAGGEGRALRPSKRERNLRKELQLAGDGGATSPTVEVVTIVARLELN